LLKRKIKKGDNALSRAKVNIVGGLMYETYEAFLVEVNSIMIKPENKVIICEAVTLVENFIQLN